MATHSPDSPSWRRLTDAARALPAPAIDVRLSVRAAILAEQAQERAPDLVSALGDLLMLRWPRCLLAGGCALALCLFALGWQQWESEMGDPIAAALSGSEIFGPNMP